MMEKKSECYWTEMAAYGRQLKIDGCSFVTEWKRDACVEHDIHYRTGQLWWILESTGKLMPGPRLTRKEADEIFRERIIIQGGWTWRAWARYYGVRWLWAGRSWKKYRKDEVWEYPK